MSFLAPLMLWGSLAAAVPIALHFFYRSRYRNVPWAAMKFLLTSIEQTSRRIRFQELLLLLLRVSLLLLLALALARPSLSGAGRSGDAVDAVLIIDTSMSMTARAGVAPPAASADPYLSALHSFAKSDGSLTCFDRARAAVLAAVAGLPAHSTVQIVSSADRAEQLGPRNPGHLDQARQILDELTPTHLGTDFLPAVKLAAEILQRGTSPGKELYLVSDMQRSGWQARQGDLAEALRGLHAKTSVRLIHCPPAAPANVALVGITPQTTLRPGERTDFAVLVRHTGKQPARNLTATLEIDGRADRRDTRPVAEIAPGETRAVILSGRIDQPGRHVLTATVGPDDLGGDNRFDLVLQVAEQGSVLLVDGAPNHRDPREAGSYYLHHELHTAGWPVALTSADRAAPADLGAKHLCALVNVRFPLADTDRPPQQAGGPTLSGDFLRALATFVREGGSVLVFAGDHVDPAAYNAWLGDRLSLLPYRITAQENTAPDRPWTLDWQGAVALPFSQFRKNKDLDLLMDRIQTRRILGLDVPDRATPAGEARVLLRFRNGRPAVVSAQRAGQGEVMLFTTSASDPAWTNLSSQPGFVLLVQAAVNHLFHGRPQEYNRVAGQPLVWQPPAAEAESAFDLIDPAGERTRVGYPQSIGGRPLVTTSDVSRAGVYHLVPAGKEVGPAAAAFAVTPEMAETEDLDYLPPAGIDALLGFTPTHATAGDTAVDFAGGDLLTGEFTAWLLLTLLAFVGFEMVLAWFCDRAPGGTPPAVR